MIQILVCKKKKKISVIHSYGIRDNKFIYCLPLKKILCLKYHVAFRLVIISYYKKKSLKKYYFVAWIFIDSR